MKLEDQVCRLEHAKRLKELGVKQESMFYWKEHQGRWYLDYCDQPLEEFNDRWCSAFNVAELGEMLPETVGAGKARKYPSDRKFYFCTYYIDDYRDCEASTEVDARAQMLIYLLENKLIAL